MSIFLKSQLESHIGLVMVKREKQVSSPPLYSQSPQETHEKQKTPHIPLSPTPTQW